MPNGALGNRMKLDPIDQGVIVDGPRVSGPPAERFEIGLTSPSDVGVINECKGNRFD